MNSEILKSDVQKFINDNLSTDIHKILLRSSPFPNISSKDLVEQIESKKKAKEKLPSWFTAENIIYPNKLNLSQTSSEVTADYKASLVKGKSLIDITGGLGIDTFAFSKKMDSVVHVEKNEFLSNIAKHNFKQLGVENVQFETGDGINFIKKSKRKFDIIYADPSRRDEENNKVYYLSDCEPDITQHLDFLFTIANTILVKTAPMLDIQIGLNQLQNVSEIHVVAINNDVKEILWLLNKNTSQNPDIKTINFTKKKPQVFEFKLDSENSTFVSYSLPKNYLYEPNAAILKSGGFNQVAQRFHVEKLHPNSHLYTSTELINFPGRVFKILNIADYSKKSAKDINLKKANITTRNFPDSVEQVRKKLRLKDGGEHYIFCTTNLNEKFRLLLCRKI